MTSPAPAPTTSTPGPAGSVARCQSAQLAGSVEGSSGAAGTLEVTLSLRNTATGACTTAGYPGAQLVDAAGNPLPTDVGRGGSYPFTDFAAVPVVLSAGEAGYVNLGYSDVPTGTTPCEQAASLWITPPGDVTHLVVALSVTACDAGRIVVSPVFVAGSAGSQTTAPPGH